MPDLRNSQKVKYQATKNINVKRQTVPLVSSKTTWAGTMFVPLDMFVIFPLDKQRTLSKDCACSQIQLRSISDVLNIPSSNAVLVCCYINKADGEANVRNFGKNVRQKIKA